MIDLPSGMIGAVLLGADYIDNGIPLKDAMNQREINMLVLAVAKYLNEKGYQLNIEDEEDEQ